MTGKSIEHRLIDSQIARLKLKRRVLDLRAQLEYTGGLVASLQDALNAERGRTTGDSVVELADVSISRKLADKTAELARIRSALRDREREMDGISQRLATAQQSIEQAHGQRQEMAARLHMSEQDGAAAERKCIVGWLRKNLHEHDMYLADLIEESEHHAEKGTDSNADLVRPAAVNPAPADAVGPAGPADPPR